MKKILIFFFSLVISPSLCGCQAPQSADPAAASLVQALHIRCTQNGEAMEFYCTHPEKVRLILLCIRTLGPDFPARVDVEALEGRTITLSMYCADGATREYRLKNNQYLQKDHGPWRKINADHAAGFYQLLLTLADADAGMHRRLWELAPQWPIPTKSPRKTG